MLRETVDNCISKVLWGHLAQLHCQGHDKRKKKQNKQTSMSMLGEGETWLKYIVWRKKVFQRKKFKNNANVWVEPCTSSSDPHTISGAGHNYSPAMKLRNRITGWQCTAAPRQQQAALYLVTPQGHCTLTSGRSWVLQAGWWGILSAGSAEGAPWLPQPSFSNIPIFMCMSASPAVCVYYTYLAIQEQ